MPAALAHCLQCPTTWKKTKWQRGPIITYGFWKGVYPYVFWHFRHLSLPSAPSMKKYRKAEYVQRRVCFVNVQSSLHENVVFSICACMCNAAYVMLFMWNFISGFDTCYHFRLNISCGVAVTVRSHHTKYQVTFKGEGRGGRCFWGMGQFLRSSSIFR